MKTYTSEEKHELMLKTPMTKLLVTMSIPTVISQLISVFYNTADTWFVSQISTRASAAVGVAFALQSLIQALGFGFGIGGGSIVGRLLGAKKDEEAAVYATSSLFISVVFGCLILTFGLIFIDPLMRLLGATETMLPYAKEYAKYILMAAPIMCAAFVLNINLRFQGEARLATIGLASGGILNVILDPILIFACNLEIAGAAIATAVSQCVSFGVMLFFFTRKSIVRLHPKYISRKFSVYWKTFTTGVPTICRQGLASIATAMLNRAAGLHGDEAVAAMSIAVKIYNLVRNVVLGIGQGFQPIASYNYGAGDKRRTREAFWRAVLIGTVISTVAAALLAIFAGPIVRWFRNDDKVVEVGIRAVYYMSMVMPLMAFSTYVN